MLVHVLNSSIQEAEARGSLSSKPLWATWYQDSQGYTERSVWKNKTYKENQLFQIVFRGLQYIYKITVLTILRVKTISNLNFFYLSSDNLYRKFLGIVMNYTKIEKETSVIINALQWND